MAHTDKDYGWHHPYFCDAKGHAEFTRECRRRRRRHELNALRHGLEPSAKDPIQYDYYD